MTNSTNPIPTPAQRWSKGRVEALKADYLLELLRRMEISRALNDQLLKIKAEGRIQGAVHRSTGQEAVGIGVCGCLNDDDYVLSHFRGYAHWIGKGMDLNALTAEFFGKATGFCKGKAGEMLITDMSKNVISTTIVGGGLPLACGMGLSIRMRKSDQVVVCFFGEGATNEGAFHESLNFAALHRLPILFVCENNQWAMASSAERMIPVRDVALRAISYGMEGMVVDGNDLFDVYDLALQLLGRLRSGEGPFLLEAKTYRRGTFSSNDRSTGYQSMHEQIRWLAKDPINRFRDQLKLLGLASEEQLDEVREKAVSNVTGSVAGAIQAPYPDGSTLLQHVFREGSAEIDGITGGIHA